MPSMQGLFGTGASVRMIITGEDIVRIEQRHFRRRRSAAANFKLWSSPRHLWSDAEVQQKFLDHVVQAFAEGAKGTESCSLSLSIPVGWSGTDDVTRYERDTLELFQPNKRSDAFRVRKERTDLKAPETQELTFIYRIIERESPAIQIYSLYPGRDIGELEGNITEREKVVFFDWDHAGT